MLNSIFRGAALALACFACVTISAQCDPMAVDFADEPWGLAPDGEVTFFDPAEVGVEYTDDVHLLVPSFASEVVPETPLDAPIDSAVIVAVLLVDTISGDTLEFVDAGLEYACNNLGDCTDPCTFLGGGQYCATFTGVPTVSGNFMLSMEVEVWATIFGFPLATPFSFAGFPFPITDGTSSVRDVEGVGAKAYPNPTAGSFVLDASVGSQAVLRSMDGQLVRQWRVNSLREQVDMAGCTPGVYFLELTAEGRREVLRLSLVR